MATGLRSWSKTASSNATADSNINFAEGMAPSAVNDSARALMASAAMWREDNNGTITTAGTSTAYTATSNQGLALVDGVTIVLQMHAINGASPTLNVDSLGAKNIQKVSGTAVSASTLPANAIFRFVYRASPDAWIVEGLFDPSLLVFAAGTALPFYQDTAPTGWTISTTLDDYALRIVKGSAAGGGTGGATGGSTAFTTVMAARTIALANLPDHNVTITDPGHTHDISSMSAQQILYTSGGVNPQVWRGDLGGTKTSNSNTTGITAAFGTSARGGAQTTMDFAVRYASFIIATKN